MFIIFLNYLNSIKQLLFPAAFILITMNCNADDLLDEIHLKNRTVVTGLIAETLPEKHVIVLVLEGGLDTIPIHNIEYIIKRKESSIDITYKNYFVLGLSLGTPSVLNLNAGYWYKRFGLSLSGNGFKNFYGLQANLGYLLYDNYESCLSANLLLGDRVNLSKLSTKYQYSGLAVDLNWEGWAVEVGWGLRTDNHRGFYLMQVGYSYRFL